MTERREIALIRSYDELIKALRARADELNVSRETIDSIAGFQQNYAGKLLAPVPIRILGRVSLGPMLTAMGLALVVVEDKAALERIAKRLVKRERQYANAGRNDAGHVRRKNRRRCRFPKGPDFARLMRARQVANQTPEDRTRIARIAAQARWSKIGK